MVEPAELRKLLSDVEELDAVVELHEEVPEEEEEVLFPELLLLETTQYCFAPPF